MDIKNLIKKYKPSEIQFVYLLAGMVFLTALFLLSWFGWQYFGKPRFDSGIINVKSGEEDGIGCNYTRVLDGVCVASAAEVNPKVVAIMIENHPDARPQSGLAVASIVYEAPVEANYTRFLAIYPETAEINKVGPVRSARPYYLDWLSEYGDALYMHVGGSSEALEKIKLYQLFDLNEFYRGWYYWRATDRLMPHNVYTSSKLWNEALTDYQSSYVTTSYEGWKFESNSPAVDSAVENDKQDVITTITASFLSPTYEAVWKYNSSTQQYDRWQTGRLHLDKDGSKIVADTIIIQRVKTQVLDEIGRKKIETIGQGEALIFKNGEMVEGKWKKESRKERTNWYDDQGELIPLKSGKIWIEVVPQDGDVSYE